MIKCLSSLDLWQLDIRKKVNALLESLVSWLGEIELIFTILKRKHGDRTLAETLLILLAASKNSQEGCFTVVSREKPYRSTVISIQECML